MLPFALRFPRIVITRGWLGQGCRKLATPSRYTNRAVAIVTKEVRRHYLNSKQLAVNSWFCGNQSAPFNPVCVRLLHSGSDIIRSRNQKIMEAKFREMLPEFVNIVCDLGKLEKSGVETAFTWLRGVLGHNLGGGKCTRGLTVVDAFCRVSGGESNVSEQQLREAMLLGWCVELMQAFFLLADDVMDQSLMRRGQTCWYRMPGVGMMAVNDSILMENILYQLVKSEFSQSPCYVYILETLQDTVFKTILGQCLDMNAGQQNKHNFSHFNDDRYNAIVEYKTSYYSFYLPVRLALHLAGLHDKARHDKAKHMLLRLGYLFQVQDDYLDCYGDPAVTGKIGVDVQDDKCTWLIVNALKICSDSQRTILEENYGRSEESNIAAVKEIYKDLDLPGIFSKFQDESYEDLLKSIEELDDSLRELFLTLLNKIYKRQK